MPQTALDLAVPPQRQEKMVIVDYDNIHKVLRRQGIYVVVGKILEQLVDPSETKHPVYRFRLYGGWYEGHNLTRAAQDLNIDISNDIPSVFPLVLGLNTHKVPVSVELAYSLAALPTKHLLDTFRKRYGPSNIQCHDPKSKGCQTHSCPLAAIPSFLKGKSCPEPNCSINADSLLFRPEQKLVDSMMLSDLLFYAHENHSPLAIVSSDDDLWPGILSALHVGAEIRHIRTQRASRFSPHYATIHPRRYISAVIS